MWSRESTATPTTAPTIQWFGSGFGQAGSTVNCGIRGVVGCIRIAMLSDAISRAMVSSGTR